MESQVHQRPIEWFECEDGYPMDDSIERLQEHVSDMGRFGPREAADFMVRQLPIICNQISAMTLSVEDGKTDFGDPAWMIEYHTGGWSGAEDLIAAMQSSFWIQQMHTKWTRGGHFDFEVPFSYLKGKDAQ